MLVKFTRKMVTKRCQVRWVLVYKHIGKGPRVSHDDWELNGAARTERQNRTDQVTLWLFR